MIKTDAQAGAALENRAAPAWIPRNGVNHMEEKQTKLIGEKPSRRIATTLGKIIMWAGIALAAVGVAYEAANLPWRTFLQDIGILSVPETLPDPKDIGADWYTGVSIGGIPSTLPQEERFLIRGDVKLKLLGYLKLPKISISENVVEGSEEAELSYAIGHMPGTAMPGQSGNSVLPAHRNYIPMHPFRNLDKMEIGDSIIFEDQHNRYVYEVYEIIVVKPTDVWVADPVEGEQCIMTLLTCTPVTTMVDRMAVRARLVTTEAL